MGQRGDICRELNNSEFDEHKVLLDLFVLEFFDWGCDISYESYQLITKLDKEFDKLSSCFPLNEYCKNTGIWVESKRGTIMTWVNTIEKNYNYIK